ncbi:DUF92 domain-containing protein [Chitinophagaceae bacterium LB-8]|uniref:DUF92 domain-containing protein n=1 Tax=Paraflavisolibacter caeni TaxID=2982496 RepID=A0A9X2XZS7_9BACT|nr:DUF92 domain-containing protein [Paraflavisolibacter caeni]MCU7551941.1 DUF92 domain-containing protein [Paraflavisolibacter caeni]
MQTDFWLLLALLLSAMFLSVRTGKLDLAGALTGGLIGFLIYLGAGFTGIAMIGAFFILGTAATSWKINYKQQLHLEEMGRGKRKASQVLANGGVAALLGLMTIFFPEHQVLFSMMMAASLSSATADTLSSELGNVYGRRFYNILTFRKDKRGLDGVVSLEGTLCGIAGSVIIALIYVTGLSWSRYFWLIIIAGTAGNILDSVLGATLQRKRFINNDAVNFFNTLAAALIALILQSIGSSL